VRPVRVNEQVLQLEGTFWFAAWVISQVPGVIVQLVAEVDQCQDEALLHHLVGV